MAHALFGDRFFSYRKTAWHNLGLVLDEQLTATEAFERIGAYDVHKERMFTSTGIDTQLDAIVRDATADDPTPRVLGTVSPSYTLITPRDFVTNWDRAVTHHVETIGVLDEGANMFVTVPLPTIDVNGDEVENYMIAESPLTGKDAITILVSSVRVVCKNTLRASRKVATETYRITHDKNAEDKLRSWLVGVYDRAVQRTDEMNRAFRAMSTSQITGAQLDNVLELTYTMPKLPRKDCPEVVYVERMKTYELHSERATTRREAAKELFEGKGVGSDTKAFRGTVWGAYNAVAELENYGGQGSAASRAQSLMFGQRGEAVERAFDACLELTMPNLRSSKRSK